MQEEIKDKFLPVKNRHKKGTDYHPIINAFLYHYYFLLYVLQISISHFINLSRKHFIKYLLTRYLAHTLFF